MANTALSFDDSEMLVTGRDDGLLNLEFRDATDKGLEGVVRMDADTAIGLGQILINRGTEIKTQLEASARPAPKRVRRPKVVEA